jgi:predicted nucleic acid-binding protein
MSNIVSNFTAVYDACVLYPAPLRDLLMELALTDLFRARWSEEIHQEWIRNVLKNRPDLQESQLLRTKAFMDNNVRDALVIGFESLIPSLCLPDENDRHVLAAAIRCNSDVIVTFNLKDFPSDYLSSYDIEVQHPDEFILYLIDLYPVQVCKAVEKVRQRLRNPTMDCERYLANLLKQGLPQTVLRMRELGYSQGYPFSTESK